MAWTTPKTYASGDVLTAADMNTYQRDNLNAVYDIANDVGDTPMAQISDQLTLANNSVTSVGASWILGVEEYDTDSIHSVSSNQERMTIPSGHGGMWMGLVYSVFTADSTGDRLALVVLDDGSANTLAATQVRATSSGSTNIVAVSPPASCSAGDYFYSQLRQTSGGSLSTTPITFTVWKVSNVEN